MQNRNNPWLGLKSYSEGIKIYGRDREIEDLSQRILYNVQTVIYGRSGIGKSSILKAGVFPVLRKNGYFPVYIRFVHDEENDSYASQIIAAVKRSLSKLRVEDLGAPDDQIIRFVEGYTEEVVPHDENSKPEGLWEFFHRHIFWYRLNEDHEPVQIFPALVFDQFEEIFTLQKDRAKVETFFAELASLINNICPQHLLSSTVKVDETQTMARSSLIKKVLVKKSDKSDYIDENNVRVILSLREDYLSHLERNIAHIPSLKNNRYCLLPLSEEAAVDVIMKPIPGLVDVEVAKAIICKVTGVDPEFFKIDDNPELEVDSAILSLYLSELFKKKSSVDSRITLDMVEKQGANIIADFYDSTIKAISEDSIHFLEKRLVTKEKRRDSIYVDQARRHGVTRKELNYLIEQRLLHEYSWRDGFRIEFTHDVLCPIIHERLEKRTLEEENRKKEELLIRAQREKKRLRLVIFGIIFTLVIGAFLVNDLFFDVKVTRYARVIKKGTWMTGFNEISLEESTHRPYHFVFYKKGRLAKHPYAVEARDAFGKLTANHNLSTYLVNHYDESDKTANKQIVEDLKRVVRWELLPDADGEFCVKERAYDKDDNVIFSYNISKTDDPLSYMSTYVDGQGFPIIMRDSCYIYLRTTIDERGFEVLQEFYDDKGFPVKNKDGAFKTERQYFDNGLQMSESSLFIEGTPMNDRFGNCGWYVIETTDDGNDQSCIIYYDDRFKPCRVQPDDVMIRKCEYDEHDRIIKATYWKLNDSSKTINSLQPYIDSGYIKFIPDVCRGGYHGYIREYNAYGQTTRECTIDEQNGIKTQTLMDYDAKGNKIYQETVDNVNHYCEVDTLSFVGDKLVFRKHFSVTEDNDTTWYDTKEWNPEKLRYVEKQYDYDYGSYTYSEYDADNRETMRAFYSVDLEIDKGLHCVTTDYKYDKENHTLEKEERYFNADGVPCGYNGPRSFHVVRCIIDSVAHAETVIRMTTPSILAEGVDTNETLSEIFYQGYMFHYDESFKVKLGESSVDESGRKCRTYGNGVFYYTMRYVNSLSCSNAREDAIGYYSVNEFDELSLTVFGDKVFAAKIYDEYYDVNGSKLMGNPPLYSIAIAIEAPPGMGFERGDILVKQDDWTMSYSDDCILYHGWIEPDYRKSHVFDVLRYSEDLNDYKLVSISTNAGDTLVDDIKYYIYPLTKREEERVLQRIEGYKFNM